jgi:hypothetical protein
MPFLFDISAGALDPTVQNKSTPLILYPSIVLNILFFFLARMFLTSVMEQK